MHRVAAVLVSTALVLIPALALAGEDAPSLVQTAVEAAETPEDHTALASHYREKAESVRAAAARHEAMAEGYVRGNLTHRKRMERHCRSIADKYRAMAADYDELAELHSQAAEKTE